MGKTYEEVLQEVQLRQQRLAEYCKELFSNTNTLTLEIGCGHGHFLTAYAEAHPQEFCLGIDIISKRIEKGTLKKEKRGLENLHFLKAELSEFLDALPEHVQLQKTFMLFPDPWPKKRHHKNRMVQPAFLSKLAQISNEDCSFFFRTDHEAYFEWTQEIVAEHPDWEVDTTIEWPFEQDSYFQNLMDNWQSLIAKKRPS